MRTIIFIFILAFIAACESKQNCTDLSIELMFQLNTNSTKDKGPNSISYIKNILNEYGTVEDIHGLLVGDDNTLKRSFIEKHGQLYLDLAMVENNYIVVSKLLENGVSPFEQTKYVNPPILNLITNPESKMLEVILNHNQDEQDMTRIIDYVESCAGQK